MGQRAYQLYPLDMVTLSIGEEEEAEEEVEQYTILDENVEVAPIYRCSGKESQPTRPHENHGLAIEHLPTWPEESMQATVKVNGSPCSRIHRTNHPKSRGHRNVHNFCCKM